MSSQNLSDEQLDAIEARLKFYEQEYWRVNEDDPLRVDVTNRDGRPMPPLIQGERFSRDEIATFVAHAPEDVQNLLDEVRRLRERNRLSTGKATFARDEAMNFRRVVVALASRPGGVRVGRDELNAVRANEQISTAENQGTNEVIFRVPGRSDKT